MEYKIQVVSTYWVLAPDRKTAEGIVKRGLVNPETVEVETLEEVPE